MSYYRTRTYIAADWTSEIEVINKLREWNDNDWYALDFTDAHDLTESRDTSLYCTIKKSLSERLSGSKTFVLIVGEHTRKLRKGSCTFCDDYRGYTGTNIAGYCKRNNRVNLDSYVDFECKNAARNNLKIVVIYNSTQVYRFKCPDVLQYAGKHIPAYKVENGVKKWNYIAIKDAIMG